LDQMAGGGAPYPAGQGSITTRRLSVLMSRLRRKFVDATSETPFRSVRGLGYELCVDFVAAYGPEPTDRGALARLDEPAPCCPDA
ncbi:MAG: helix-turn-helix domain-containing protein, partial [Burkholderiaceae bacterium]